MPCLAAIGGWSDASWFSPSVLSDPDVVAFDLPKLAGVRQQRFQIVDRARGTVRSGRAKLKPEQAPRRIAGKLANLLAGYGMTNAVASCRSRLLFESAPVLFFAEIPLARLKLRPANKLRRELVALALRACVVRLDATLATLMVWPAVEHTITAFVALASPDHDTHAEFEAAPSPIAKRGSPPTGKPVRHERSGGEREARLLQQIATLQSRIDTLTRAQSARGALEQLGLDDARLKSMLKLLHPDKHANSEAATDAAKWLNAMRDLLKGGAVS